MTRWSYDRLATEWDWRVENVMKMGAGGASQEDVAPLRAEIDKLFVLAGWTEAEFTAQIDKRVDRYFAKEKRAKKRQQ